jgi:hypothetical protein
MQHLLTTVLLLSEHWHHLLFNTVSCEPCINKGLCILMTDISCYKVTDDGPQSGVPSSALELDWTVQCTLQKTQDLNSLPLLQCSWPETIVDIWITHHHATQTVVYFCHWRRLCIFIVDSHTVETQVCFGLAHGHTLVDLLTSVFRICLQSTHIVCRQV